MLREDDVEPAPQAPQPTLRDIAALVDASRSAGADVDLEMRVEEPHALPEPLGRAAYRIVQETLTNVHKHAHGAATTVSLHGAPGRGLQVRVRNQLPRDGTGAPAWPGGGRGLIGLAERVALAGGTLAHGPDPDDGFVVDARLEDRDPPQQVEYHDAAGPRRRLQHGRTVGAVRDLGHDSELRPPARCRSSPGSRPPPHPFDGEVPAGHVKR